MYSELNDVPTTFFSSNPQKGRPRKRKALQQPSEPTDLSRSSAMRIGKL